MDSAAHKRERALLMPPFHGMRMKTYGQLIQTTAIRRAAAWKPDQSFVMQESTQAISLEVILQAIFGIRHVVYIPPEPGSKRRNTVGASKC